MSAFKLTMSVKNLVPFKNVIKILRIFGFWINKSSTKRYVIYGIVLRILFLDLCMLLQIACIPMLESVEDWANLMSLLPIYVGCFFKSINIVSKRTQIEKLFELTDEILKECSDTIKIERRLKTVNNFFKASVTSTMMASIVSAFVGLFKLQYKMWFPFDTENNQFGYWISRIYQSVGPLGLAPSSVSLDLIAISFMCYSVGFLEIFCNRLESIKSALKRGHKDVENMEIQIDNHGEFVKCIRFQLKVEEYSRLIMETFSAVFFVQGLITIPILCTSTVLLTYVS